MTDESPNKPGLFAELKRRKVVRAALTYLVGAWLVLQVAAILLPTFDVPAWGMRLVVFMCALGFPLVVVLAWAFELSPEGMRRTRSSEEEAETETPPQQNKRRNIAAFALGALIPSVALIIFLAVALLLPDSDSASSTVREKSIAVLPFANLSANEENAYFAAGMHDDLLTQLSRIDDLKVASRTSVMRYGENPENMRTIAEELGVRYIVEGSVQRVADDIRIIVQLIDATTDENLWSENFDRKLENIFVMQSEISRSIADRVQARISPEEAKALDSIPTTVVAAYDAYLKVREKLTGFWVGFDVLDESEKQLEFAIRADPEFVEAWALLAIVHSRRYLQMSNADEASPVVEESKRKAREMLDTAIELAPDNLAVLRARGFHAFIVNQDYLEGARSLDKAISQVPNDTDTLFTLAFCYRRLGQMDKAIGLLTQVYAQDPDNWRAFYFLTDCLRATGQYERLIPIYERRLALNPDEKHFFLEKLYYQFLSTGKLEIFKQYEKALNEIEITEGCDPSSWRKGRMTVAMLNNEFDAYAKDWHVKWEQHHEGHGDWVCPLQVNEEANHAALLLLQGKKEAADEIIAESFNNIELPPNPLAECTFDTQMIRPKLYYMKDNPEEALKDLNNAIRKLNDKPDYLLKYIEKSVLLEAADLIAPEMAFPLFEDIQNDPVQLTTLETVCANPWSYPNLLADERFQEKVIADGRFVEFLQHYGFLS